MIKLIASDMDGTLLDDEKRLPEDFFTVLDKLSERNITFAVASGRTYSALEHLFPVEYTDRISYICDNGACVVHKGEVLECELLTRDVYEKLVEFCEREDGISMLACGKKSVYHLDLGKEFCEDVEMYYKRHTIVKDFLSIDDEFFKLAVCDANGSVVHGKPLFDRVFGDTLNVQASGEAWMDVMPGGVSKGKALKRFRERLGISRSETMAFGDYFNDADMLAEAEWSFAMENGREEIKKMAKYIAPDNNSGGVIACIKKFVLE